MNNTIVVTIIIKILTAIVIANMGIFYPYKMGAEEGNCLAAFTCNCRQNCHHYSHRNYHCHIKAVISIVIAIVILERGSLDPYKMAPATALQLPLSSSPSKQPTQVDIYFLSIILLPIFLHIFLHLTLPST